MRTRSLVVIRLFLALIITAFFARMIMVEHKKYEHKLVMLPANTVTPAKDLAALLIKDLEGVETFKKIITKFPDAPKETLKGIAYTTQILPAKKNTEPPIYLSIMVKKDETYPKAAAMASFIESICLEKINAIPLKE